LERERSLEAPSFDGLPERQLLESRLLSQLDEGGALRLLALTLFSDFQPLFGSQFSQSLLCAPRSK